MFSLLKSEKIGVFKFNIVYFGNRSQRRAFTQAALYYSIPSYSFHGEIKTQASPHMKLMRPELEKYCDSRKRDGLAIYYLYFQTINKK